VLTPRSCPASPRHAHARSPAAPPNPNSVEIVANMSYSTAEQDPSSQRLDLIEQALVVGAKV
jgi:hypothetical protein